MEKQKPKLVPGGAQEVKAPSDTKAEPKSAQSNQAVSAPKAEAQGLTQREAVYVEVMRVIREEKISVGENQPVKPLLNETHIKKICAGLLAGFQSKKIPLKETDSNKKKLADAKVMELYCLGLLNNWLRRDKRLNGMQSAK